MEVLRSVKQTKPKILRQELKQNEDVLFVTSVEELLKAWQRKYGFIFGHKSCSPSHTPVSSIHYATIPNTSTRPSTRLCHVSSKANSLDADAVPSITKENIGDIIEFVDSKLSGFIIPAKDTLMHVVPIAKDLGLYGKVVIKTVKNKEYVIIKGYSGSRSFLTGTRYLSTHPKILQLAIGKVGLKRTIRGGGILSVYITISLQLLKLVLGKKELEECGIAIASDLVKIGIATILGEAASIMVAGTAIGAIASGPIIVAIVVGVGVVLALDALDNHYNITNRVAAMMHKMSEKIVQELCKDYDNAAEWIYQGLRHWIYHESNGFDIENPI
jgi:hypothetical protein